MVTEKIEKLTSNTLIPLSLVLSISAGIWSLATMNAKISANELAIVEVKSLCSNNPTRSEFTALQGDIREIKGDIKTLITGHNVGGK